MIKKIVVYKKNSEKSCTTKVTEYIPSGFSMSTVLSFKDIENKIYIYTAVKIAWKSFMNP